MSEFFSDSGCTDESMEDFSLRIPDPVLPGEPPSPEVCQEPPTLSPTFLDVPTHTTQTQQNPDTPTELERSCITLTARQKIAHSQSERRYRRNLDAMFSQLEDAVGPCHSEEGNSSSRPSKRVRRVKLLGMASMRIFELQKELQSTKKKLQILRVATVPPEALKFTLQDENV